MRLVRSLRRPSASASLAFITYIDTTTHTYTVLPHDCPTPPLPTCHYGIGVAASASMPLGISGSIGGGRSASSGSSMCDAARNTSLKPAGVVPLGGVTERIEGRSRRPPRRRPHALECSRR